MLFDENSGLVKVWVNLVRAGTYTIDQVPELFNLKEIVLQGIEAMQAQQ